MLLLGLASAMTACSSQDGLGHGGAERELGTNEGPPRVQGVWHVESTFQGRTIPANLILEKAESGTLVGVWESMGQEMDLREVSYEAGVLHFARAMGSGGQELTFEGSVVEGELRGVQHAGEMEIPCIGTRFRVDRDGPDQSAPAAAAFDDTAAYLDELEADYDQNVMRAAPRDSFDVLDGPEMLPAALATTLDDDEYVLGVQLGGEARAYPIGALGSSELLNDVCGGIPIAASW